MRRRRLLQSLLFAPLLALIRRPAAAQARPPGGTSYSDSDGGDSAVLAPLYDGNTVSDGVVYQP